VRVSLTDATVTTLATDSNLGTGAIESAGTYLYVAGQDSNGIRRYTKATGAWVNVAGTNAAGYQDGPGTDAYFSAVKAISSDGGALWIGDNTNHRIRKVINSAALPSSQSGLPGVSVNINPGAVTTFAGSGANSNVNGIGSAASFATMGGSVVVGSFLFVGANSAIRKVDLASGQVTTLSGDNSNTGCFDSATAASATYTGVSGLTTDGYYLYALSGGCGSGTQSAVRRVSLTTGASSTVVVLDPPNATGMAYGPDGALYVTSYNGSQWYIRKVDRLTGAVSDFTTMRSGQSFGLTADSQYLWLLTSAYPNQSIVRVSLTDATVTTLATDSNLGTGAIESAGTYLYVAGQDSNAIRRYTKASGAWVNVAGTSTAGYQDGSGSTARFSAIKAISSDGSSLWIGDNTNHRIRAVLNPHLFDNNGGAFGWDGYGAFWGAVNATLGNFVKSQVDASVATPGPDLKLERTYNGLDSRIGGFGLGWTFNYDMTWQTAADGSGAISVSYPDGRREVHTPNGQGGFTPPAGYFSTLASDGAGGYRLTEKNRTVYAFGSDGTLRSVTDAIGRQLTLGYDGSGHVLTATAASSRHLYFTWSGSQLTSVRTDAVTANGGPLVWNYFYTGNLLTRVCDARNPNQTGSCTIYDYTANRLSKITTPRGTTEVQVSYLPDGRVNWRQDGLGNLTTFGYPSATTTFVTDPLAHSTYQTYDDHYRLTSQTDPGGFVTSYTYDSVGNRSGTTDANNTTSTLAYDSRGNVLSTTDGEAHTSYKAYDSQDNLTAARDARSASSTDDTYKTSYTYDSAGNKLSETSPATADFPAGVTKSWTYTAGSEAAPGGGTMPAGLVRTATDARGNVTTSTYNRYGDLVEVVDALGLRTDYVYDEVGRKTTQTVYSDSFPAGVTTTTGYDPLGKVLTETAPAVTNSITGVAHQKRTVTAYDGNENLLTETVSDLLGGDVAHVTVHSYDALDREVSTTDAEGGVTSRVFDQAGNVIRVTDANGHLVLSAYDNRNLLSATISVGFVDDPVAATAPRDVTMHRFGYDPARRKVTDIDALGRTSRWVYDRADRILSVTRLGYVNADGSRTDVVMEAHSYDAAGHALSDTSGNGLRIVTHDYDPAGREITMTADPAGVHRTAALHYDRDGNLTSRTIADSARSETTAFTYDAANHKISETVVMTGAGADLVSHWAYDQRGVATSTTDRRGAVTTYTSDELGRTTAVVQPAVAVEENGGTASTSQPTNRTGYDTYGNPAQQADPRGFVTVTDYDRLNRRTRITHPTYSTPGGPTVVPTETFAYDHVGNVVSRTDRRGQTTSFVFDNWNRPVRQYDPPISTQPLVQGQIQTIYDDASHKTAEIDQRGARTEWTYDDLDRVRTMTKLERVASGPPTRYTTTYDYDYQGDLTYQASPAGEITRHGYDPLGDQTSTTDPTGAVSTTTYNIAGRKLRNTDPLGRTVEHVYDPAGRETQTRRYSPAGTVLTTATVSYDADDNPTSQTSPRGNTTTYDYDALNRLSAVHVPVAASQTITTSYGYDPAGNPTRVTDGRGNPTTWTYNPWSLPQSTIEPTTTAYPALVDRTFTTAYDPAGLAITDTQPGGVVVSRTYDPLGRLTGETGTSPTDPTAARSFGYDLGGLPTSISHPGGTETFAYNDRQLPTAAAGPAGNASYAYDADGRLTVRTDPAGTAQFGWTARNELVIASDSISGVSRTYSWDPAGEVTTVALPGGVTRTLNYDDLGQLTTDTLVGHSQTQAAFAYTYDQDGNPTSQTITLAGNPAAGTHTYTYDQAGRLTTWTNPGNQATVYGWDNAGNRTTAGNQTFTYNQRNQLTAGADGTRTYTARGSLTSIGATSYVTDALGRVTTAGPVSYTYDSLDRIATRNTTPFTYTGMSIEPDSDGTLTTLRSPAGRALTIQPTGGPALIPGFDRHGDLTHLYSVDGTLTDSRIYDPFGTPIGTTGTTNPTLGYQGKYTDPTTSNAWFGARWYQPSSGGFLGRDTIRGELKTPIALNRYTYANNNPLLYADPDGRLVNKPDGGQVDVCRCEDPNSPTYGLSHDRSSPFGSYANSDSGNVDGGSRTKGSDDTTARAADGRSAATAADRTVDTQTRRVQAPQHYIFVRGQQVPLPTGFEDWSIETKKQWIDENANDTRLSPGAFDLGALTTDAYRGGANGAWSFINGFTNVVSLGNGTHLAAPYKDPIYRLSSAAGLYGGRIAALLGTLDVFSQAASAALPAVALVGGGVAVVDGLGLAVTLGSLSWAGAEVQYLSHAASDSDSQANSGPNQPDQKAAEEGTAAIAGEGPSGVPNFENPAASPGEGWEWRGTGEPGSTKGSWYNPDTGESLHPDVGHPDPIGPHYDWKAPDGATYRVYPDGRIVPK
jgi:RHS repeat-associated protein